KTSRNETTGDSTPKLAKSVYSTVPGSGNLTDFPYTTLFRSVDAALPGIERSTAGLPRALPGDSAGHAGLSAAAGAPAPRQSPPRSEEHTSELQSRENLVCRLLLEKK